MSVKLIIHDTPKRGRGRPKKVNIIDLNYYFSSILFCKEDYITHQVLIIFLLSNIKLTKRVHEDNNEPQESALKKRGRPKKMVQIIFCKPQTEADLRATSSNMSETSRAVGTIMETVKTTQQAQDEDDESRSGELTIDTSCEDS